MHLVAYFVDGLVMGDLLDWKTRGWIFEDHDLEWNLSIPNASDASHNTHYVDVS